MDEQFGVAAHPSGVSRTPLEIRNGCSYNSLTRAGLNITRDYDLFTVLALGPGGSTDDLPDPPRGLLTKMEAERE